MNGRTPTTGPVDLVALIEEHLRAEVAKKAARAVGWFDAEEGASALVTKLGPEQAARLGAALLSFSAAEVDMSLPEAQRAPAQFWAAVEPALAVAERVAAAVACYKDAPEVWQRAAIDARGLIDGSLVNVEAVSTARPGGEA